MPSKPPSPLEFTTPEISRNTSLLMTAGSLSNWRTTPPFSTTYQRFALAGACSSASGCEKVRLGNARSVAIVGGPDGGGSVPTPPASLPPPQDANNTVLKIIKARLGFCIVMPPGWLDPSIGVSDAAVTMSPVRDSLIELPLFSGERRVSISSNRLFQLFKYCVYALLAFNVYVFWDEEIRAAMVQFPGGVAPGDLIEAYAATIDTLAWVVLLLMFELETYVLEDRHFTPLVTHTLHIVRIACYCFIVYACYGYVVNLYVVYDTTTLAGIGDLCSLAGGDWSYAVDLDEYETITASSCSGFSGALTFQQFVGVNAVVDAAGLGDIRGLAWVDVINSATWLLVVAMLEFDARLLERGTIGGPLVGASRNVKFALYAILFGAAVYWGINGDFVDFWDAFLWLVAFFFIEMNVVEWRDEVRDEQVTA